MTTSNTPFDGIDSRVADATAAIKGLEAPATEAADAIDQAFAKAGQSLARSLSRAASDGKISLKELAAAILAAVDQAAGVSPSSGGIGGGLGSALAQILSAAGTFSGARADGGPVLPGGAYLVGERGPEVFRPNSGGSVEAPALSNVNITLNVTGSAQGLVRSEAQIASTLNRAARMGLR